MPCFGRDETWMRLLIWAENHQVPTSKSIRSRFNSREGLEFRLAQAHEIYGLAWRTSVQIMDPGIRISVQAQIGSAWSALCPETGSRIFEEALKAAYNLDDPKEKALGIIAIGLQWGKWAPGQNFQSGLAYTAGMVAERLVLFLSTAGETRPAKPWIGL